MEVIFIISRTDGLIRRTIPDGNWSRIFSIVDIVIADIGITNEVPTSILSRSSFVICQYQTLILCFETGLLHLQNQRTLLVALEDIALSFLQLFCSYRQILPSTLTVIGTLCAIIITEHEFTSTFLLRVKPDIRQHDIEWEREEIPLVGIHFNLEL